MDPTFELINKCLSILRSDTSVSSLVGDRIYDRVPEKQDGTPNVKSPYISLGSTSFLTDDYDCVDAATIGIQFHCWSWGDGEQYSSAMVRKLAFFVRKALHKKDINLDNNGFVSIEHQITAYNRAIDGVTHQASVGFETLIDIV
jgi:hypothetical protein